MKWSIKLTQAEVLMRVGICDHEVTPQRIWVDVELEMAYPKLPQNISECADYAVVYNYIRLWENRPHTDLLETLAVDLAAHIFKAMPLVSHVKSTISKPDIFDKAQSVAVVLEVGREE